MKEKNSAPNKLQNALINAIGIPQYLSQVEIKAQDVFINRDEEFKERENKMWYKGDAASLEWFYKTNFRNYMYPTHDFYRVVNSDIPRAHYPLASAISNSFGSLLFSNYPTFVIDTGSVEKNKKYSDKLRKILDVNDILSLLQNSAQLQSYSGSVALKLNFDPTISDLPLITAYPKEEFKPHKRYGQLIYIDFEDYYGDYMLVSRYGLGYISYKLFKGKDEVALTSIPETAGLQDVAFADIEGNLLPIMFATVVQNKSGERSDYDGLVSSFHALDEAFSSMVNYIRKTKPNIFISEDIAAKDSNGNPRPLNNFDNVITILDSTPDGSKTDIERDVVDVNVEGYRAAFEAIREEILMKVSLSPGTLGLPSGGARESSMALNIRERASMRSRNEKLAIWKEKLNSFLFAALVFDDIMNNAEFTDNGFYIVNKFKEFSIDSDFGSYVEETLQEKIKMYSDALKNKVCSVGFAITQIYGHMMGDTELLYLIIDTKKENGIALTAEEEAFVAEQNAAKPKSKFSILNFKEPTV